MILKGIRLKNIRSFLDERIDFPLGSLLLSGDIGSGKSTILLAIDFALFGLRRGELSGSDLLRHGKNSGSVELFFAINGRDVTIKRTLKRSKESVTQDSGMLEIDNVRYELMPTEIRANVLELFGYPGFGKVNIFRYTVYCPQEEMKHILFYPEERLNTLRKVFDIEKYGKIRENSKLFITELRAMKRELEAYTRDFDDKIKEREEKETDKEKIKDRINDQIESIRKIDQRLQKKKSEIELNEKEIEELNKMKNEIIKKEAELESKKRRTERTGKELEECEGKINPIRDELQKYREPKRPERNEEELTDMIASSEKEKEALISEKAIIDDDIRKLKNIFEKGVCDVCEQKVYSPEAFKDNIEKKLKNEKEISAKTDSLVKNLNGLKKEQEELNSYRIIIGKREQLEKVLNDLISNKNELESEMKYLVNEIRAIQNDLFLLKPRIESLTVLEGENKKLRSEYDEILKEKMAYEKDRSRLEQQLEDIERTVSSLLKEIDEKKKGREKIIRLDEFVNFFDSYFINLTLLIEKNVMVAVQEEFNSLFQNWFRILIGEELSVRVDEQFSPIIEQNGYETEYQNLSGGEKTSVALAYRLALNKVINSLVETIKTKDLLILDEPTDGFSSDQLDRMRDVINELNLRQIVIVSHEPKIDTFVDNVIKLYKEGHVSRIEKPE